MAIISDLILTQLLRLNDRTFLEREKNSDPKVFKLVHPLKFKLVKFSGIEFKHYQKNHYL